VARRMEASKGGAGGGGVTCAMRRGGEGAREAIPAVVGLVGFQNRGGGGAARRGGEDEAP